MSRRALVFGARGALGTCLLPRLHAAGWTIDAVSRTRADSSEPGLRWHRADLFADATPLPQADVLFSLGPLDGLVHWMQRAPAVPARIVAFGSTSRATKAASPDPRERALAESLRHSEAELERLAALRGARWTLLRPTLIYGTGHDRNLSRIAQLARRWRMFVLPRGATGLRQPVHADDLAAAALAALDRATAFDRDFDLPGGETLSYREMVRRLLACLQPRAHLVELPQPLVRTALALARGAGALRDAGQGVLDRLRSDLVFDPGAAQSAFGYTARGFAPEDAMFRPQPMPAMLHRNTV